MNKGNEQVGSDSKASDLYVFRRYSVSISSGALILKEDCRGLISSQSGSSYCGLQVTLPLSVLFNDAVTYYVHIAAVKNERMDERVWSVGEMTLKGKDRSTQRKATHSFVLSRTNRTKCPGPLNR
jgi:hypothetical protein